MHASKSELYTLSLHDALPIFESASEPLMIACDFGLLMESFEKLLENALSVSSADAGVRVQVSPAKEFPSGMPPRRRKRDRKSTRLNSSHVEISYAVFCLKKKT